MFTSAFASQCGSQCDQMWEWTAFKPDIEQYKNDPAVRDYVRALQATNPQVDVYNAFAERGYVGMQFLVQALQKVGPDLTRGRLQAALNGTCLQSGLTIQPKVCYSAGTRFADLTMQAFQIQYKGTFGGWRAGDIVRDTHPGAG
jgi:ABC-type branched-subunit amino acid transport system substrate-binding protein